MDNDKVYMLVNLKIMSDMRGYASIIVEDTDGIIHMPEVDDPNKADHTTCGIAMGEKWLYSLSNYITCDNCGHELITANYAVIADRANAEALKPTLIDHLTQSMKTRRGRRAARRKFRKRRD